MLNSTLSEFHITALKTKSVTLASFVETWVTHYKTIARKVLWVPSQTERWVFNRKKILQSCELNLPGEGKKKKQATEQSSMLFHMCRLQLKCKLLHFSHLSCGSYYMYWQKHHLCMLWTSTHWHKLFLFCWTVTSSNQGCNDMCCLAKPIGNHLSKVCWVEKREMVRVRWTTEKVKSKKVTWAEKKT